MTTLASNYIPSDLFGIILGRVFQGGGGRAYTGGNFDFKNWLGLDLLNKNSLKQLRQLAYIREASKLGGEWITGPTNYLFWTNWRKS